MTSASRIKDKCVARGSYLLTHSDDASKNEESFNHFKCITRYYIYRYSMERSLMRVE